MGFMDFMVGRKQPNLSCAFCEQEVEEMQFKADPAQTPYAVCRSCVSTYQLSDWADISEDEYYLTR